MTLRILIATHNRARILAETLEAMTKLERPGMEVEWVVVNNACDDATDAVVDSFRTRLPLRLLHQPVPGKNRALNLALDHCPPCDTVVFTDDDVGPCPDWLVAIREAIGRWPDDAVFGGPILPQWPDGTPSPWIREPWLLSIGFAHHDFGPTESPYPPATYPFGPNFWVRNTLFRDGLRFPESIGPVGATRIMGSETSFLKDLAQRGHRMVYCPAARVAHRVKTTDCDPRVLARRMASHGRGRARIHGVDFHNLLSEHPWRWHARQVVKFGLEHALLALVHLLPTTCARRHRVLWQHSRIGWIRESFVIARERRLAACPKPEPGIPTP